MRLSDCIINPEKLPGYSPQAHVGTTNQRLIGREMVGARNLEVVLGTVMPGGQAEPHFHSEAEQVVYILEGEVEVEMWGERQVAGPQQVVYLPPGQVHRLAAHGGKAVKVLVIYAPPIQAAAQPFQR